MHRHRNVSFPVGISKQRRDCRKLCCVLLPHRDLSPSYCSVGQKVSDFIPEATLISGKSENYAKHDPKLDLFG